MEYRGVSRRTRDAAVEAARRAGMGLEDWLDDVIADHADWTCARGPTRTMPPTIGSTRLLDVSNASRDESTPVKAPRAAGMPGAFDTVIERFEVRLARAEAEAARAFEVVAQILERDDAARDGDRAR